MRLKHSFCNSENRIGSELLQVSEVSHKSWSLTIRLVIKRLLLRGEVYCKRCIMKDGRVVLVSDNEKYAPIEIGLSDQFKKYGDVIGKYHVD